MVTRIADMVETLKATRASGRGLGEILAAAREMGEMAKGGEQYHGTGSSREPVVQTLAGHGLTKTLSVRGAVR
jgi:hypothetical protein